MILKFAADHCGKVMLLSGSFFSGLVFNMILVPPEAPRTVSRSSSRTTGTELANTGISRGRLPLGVGLGSSSFCAGSANSSERPRRMGSPSDSSKALSSSLTSEVIKKGQHSEAQGIVNEVVNWSIRNRVKLNTDKCKELCISFTSDFDFPPVVIGEE